MELIHSLNYTVRDCDVDRFGRLKPSAALFFAQDAAGEHCKLLALDYDTLAARRLFWAVIRTRLQVTRMPASGEKITVETWPMPTTRVAYPRSTVAYDAEGRELFRAISLWVLMDLDSRNMILPGKSGVEVTGLLRGSELATPGNLVLHPLSNSRSRQVCFTDLDRNGHMNNCRYLDWICDLLPGEFHRAHPMRELTLCYMSEAREGDALVLQWDAQAEDTLRFDGIKADTEGGRVFSAQIQF